MEEQEKATIQSVQSVIAPMNEPVIEKPRKKSFVLIIVLVFFFLFLAGAGGIFAYAFFSNKNIPVISDLVEKVENAAISDDKFAEMVQDQLSTAIFSTIKKTSSVTAADSIVEIDASEEFLNNYAESTTNELFSYRFDSLMDINVQSSYEDYPDAINIQIGLDGALISKDDTLSLETNILGEYNESETSLTFDSDLKVLEEIFYFKVNELPDFGIDLTEFLNEWYFIDISENEELIEGLKEGQGVTTEEEVSEEDLERVNQLIMGETIKANIVRLPDMVLEDEEKFGESTGTRTNCFELDLDGDDMVDLMKEIQVIWEIESEDEITAEDEIEIKETFKKISVGACVGRKDYQVYKYMFNVEFSPEGTDMKLSGWSEMWDHNKDITISKPSDAVNFEDAIEDIMGTVSLEPSSFGPGEQLSSTRNLRRKEDVNALLQATSTYVIDNNGEFPTIGGNPLSTLSIDDGYAYCEEIGGCYATELDEIADGYGAYLTEIPVDPYYYSDYLIGVDDSTNPMHITVATNYMEEGDDQVGTLYYLTY